jgi:Tfp pilus assembly protein PilO
MELEDLIDKYRNSKQQIRYGLVILVALLPALHTWLTQGDALEARRNQVEVGVNDERHKFEAAKQQVAELPELMAKLSEIEEELTRAKQFLPDRIEMDNILGSLGKLEKELDVKIFKFSPGQEYQPNMNLEYKEIPVELVLHAPFPQTMRFLDRLVHMPNLTHLRNIQFGNAIQNVDRKEGDAPILETSARLILFKGI